LRRAKKLAAGDGDGLVVADADADAVAETDAGANVEVGVGEACSILIVSFGIDGLDDGEKDSLTDAAGGSSARSCEPVAC
jgi:hypothetical protein